jgi:hypothetical protein
MGDLDHARPRLKRRGMPEMKVLTVRLGTTYDGLFAGSQFARRGYLGFMYEVCNLSDGQRSVADIARTLSHEVAPIEIDVVARMCRDLARLDILTLDAP